jgi:type II secretion system protein C
VQFSAVSGNRYLLRTAVVLAAASFAAVILWDTGFSPSALADWWHRQTARDTTVPHPVVLAPHTGVAARSSAPVGRLGTDASASPVALQLALVRTIPGASSTSGQALIGTDREHPQTYLAGAILETGARLAEIYPDHVVLVKGNRRALLYVEGNGKSAGVASDIADMTKVGGPVAAVEEQQLSSAPVTDFVRSQPVYENGVIVGFQIYAGRQSAAFNRWGLKPGDVVTALNGQPLSDSDQAMELLNSLTSGATLTAKIRRNGAQDTEVVLNGADLPQ